MQEGTSLVWRNAFYLDSLNIDDLPRHLISMDEGSGRQRKAVTWIILTLCDYLLVYIGGLPVMIPMGRLMISSKVQASGIIIKG